MFTLPLRPSLYLLVDGWSLAEDFYFSNMRISCGDGPEREGVVSLLPILFNRWMDWDIMVHQRT